MAQHNRDNLELSYETSVTGFFIPQIVTSVASTGPAKDEILKSQFESFVVVAGVAGPGHESAQCHFSPSSTG